VRYIHAPTRRRLTDIIRQFRDITGLPNVVGATDGTHIHLSYKPHRVLTPMHCDFFNKKKIHSVLLQAVCDSELFFGMFVQNNMEECMMQRNLRGLDFTHNYKDETSCLNMF
jgi:hypothetical protein